VKIRAALCAVLIGLGSGPAFAQMMVPYDLMPPYEVARVVRSSGLIPVAPPMRSGVAYIVRAMDRYGTPVRMVIDGRSGEIVEVRRIAAAAPDYGYPRREPPPYGYSRGEPPPYGYPRGEAAPGYRAAPPPAAAVPSREDRQVPPRTTEPRSAAVTPAHPPVPRARPSTAAPAQASIAKPEPEPGRAPDAAVAPSPGEKTPAQPEAFPPAQSLE
jgi:hypothetical protein